MIKQISLIMEILFDEVNNRCWKYKYFILFFLFEKVIITERIHTKEISENKLNKIIK